MNYRWDLTLGRLLSELSLITCVSGLPRRAKQPSGWMREAELRVTTAARRNIDRFLRVLPDFALSPNPKQPLYHARMRRHNPSQDKNGSVICISQHYFVPGVLDVTK